MKAKFTKQVMNARRDYKKVQVDQWLLVTLHKGELKTVVQVECTMGASRNSSVVHANIWVGGPKETSGHGSAGGGGYHKVSAAVDSAIDSAGIKLYGSPVSDRNGLVWTYDGGERVQETEDLKQQCHIHGVGDNAVKVALMAIAEAAGYRGKKIFA